MKSKSSKCVFLLGPLFVLALEHVLDQAHQRGNVAAGANLAVERRNLRRLLRDHLERVLRVDELDQALLTHRIEGDDLAPTLHRPLQRVKEARTVRSGVLAEEEDRVALVEVFELTGANRRAGDLL
ncbi:MAG: hypothetical protein ACXU68_10730 [Croceibacterium sp.]